MAPHFLNFTLGRGELLASCSGQLSFEENFPGIHQKGFRVSLDIGAKRRNSA